MKIKFKKIINTALIILIIALLAFIEGSVFYDQRKNIKSLQKAVEALALNISDFQTQADSKLNDLNSQIQDNASSLGKRISDLENTAEILEKKTPIVKQTQEEQLTEAVSKIAPAVVSIVITKDVPKLEIVYENPFGDDPFFKDFGFQIPRYRQKGVESQKVGAGTGFLITKDGYIITNKHVVNDTEASYTALLADGEQKAAKVIYKDEANDVTVIKIDGNNFTPVVLGDSSAMKLGQTVFAVGNALGEYNNSVSTGIISGLNREIEASDGYGTEKLSGVIQTDAAINPGNSGGPLVTLEGKVIGVNVATVRGSNNISFSIPINTIREIVGKVIK